MSGRIELLVSVNVMYKMCISSAISTCFYHEICLYWNILLNMQSESRHLRSLLTLGALYSVIIRRTDVNDMHEKVGTQYILTCKRLVIKCSSIFCIKVPFVSVPSIVYTMPDDKSPVQGRPEWSNAGFGRPDSFMPIHRGSAVLKHLAFFVYLI